MSVEDNRRAVIDRKIAEIDNQIALYQTEGRDNGDKAIRDLVDARRALQKEREGLGRNAPVDRTDRDDPVTGSDLKT